MMRPSGERMRATVWPQGSARGGAAVVALRLEFLSRVGDRVGVGHLELDAGLRNGNVAWPVGGSVAGSGGLGQRPDTKVLAARDVLAGEVVLVELLERQPQRVEVKPPARRWVRAMMATLVMNCTCMVFTLPAIADCVMSTRDCMASRIAGSGGRFMNETDARGRATGRIWPRPVGGTWCIAPARLGVAAPSAG